MRYQTYVLHLIDGTAIPVSYTHLDVYKRQSLEGAEFALKITGSAAKNLAAALYTVLKDQKKTKEMCIRDRV